MHHRLRAALVAALCFASLLPAAQAQQASPDNVWREVRERDVPRNARARQIVPERYRSLTLDRARLNALLATAPHERAKSAGRSPLELSLPLPEGGYGLYAVVESPIMEPGLAAKYPQIRTFLGQSLDDPTATVRFDLTPKGFHAQVIGAGGTVLIDPYQPGDIDHYIAYRKRDHLDGERGICHVSGEPVASSHGRSRAKIASGATLRTYRLAMAATGEYTAFHGGTVIDGLSAIVTTMNRVNGIYEREVSVRMVLVANNDLIIYTNAATDPYANSSGDLGANQSNLTSVIGTPNFDIGHLVGTGGGGVAVLDSPCDATVKAQGLTGSPAPLGDAFDVDFVAHEMGHQFGGNHTFNGSGVNCSGGNRNAGTAYEPGSGVTIQAYAGICGGDDLQPNSEDYFHRVSLNEIIAFTTDAGSGGSCAVTSSTGNNVPTVNVAPAFSVPGRTPFTLTATGLDGDGDVLTYVWEQFDLGSANPEGSLSPTTALGPMFRSFAPTTDPSRTFPSWRWILDNANIPPATAPLPGTAAPSWFTGEVLPNVSRTLNFRVTARDNRAGGGGTNEAATAVAIVNTAGPFAVTAPNSAVSLAAGAATPVTWNVTGSNLPPIGTANVRISLSADGGTTFPYELAASTPNDGSESVTLPAGLASTQARIRVQAVGNIFFDVSDSNFIVTTAGNTAPSINVSAALTTRQGSPTASAVVATISDVQDPASTLAVGVTGAPSELAVAAQNVGGSVTLSATAQCTLVAPSSGSKTYPVTLSATDSAGAVSSASVNVNVGSNRAPTLGNYATLSMTPGDARQALPATPAADADGNLSSVTVSPTSLPGGGTVAVAADGTVSVTTTAGTTLGSHAITVQVLDSCGAVEARRFTLDVATPQITLALAGSQVVTGNALIEPNECNQVNLSLRNDGNLTATGVSATLSSGTANTTITQAMAAFPDIAPGETRTSLTPFEVSTGAAATCFSNIAGTLAVSYSGAAGSPASLPVSLPIGQAGGSNYVFVASAGATLPNDGVLVAGSQGDDALASVVVPAGFNFSLYGTTYAAGTTLRASINGNLQFRPTQGADDYDPLALPTAGIGNGQAVFPPTAPTLFLQWDDWLTDPAGGAAGDAGIYTKLEGSAPNRRWIIEWRGRILSDGAAGSNNNRAAIVLHENGGSNANTFEYIYLLTGTGSSANAAGATIGVQAASSGTVFTQFAFGNANLAPGTRLTASIPPAICAAGTGACSGGAAGVTLTQSGGNTSVVEGGATDSYTVVLSSAPSGTVTVTLAPDAQLSTSPTPSLSFTPADWNIAQTVTVSAVNDALAEGAHGGTITHAASGGGYTGVAIANIVATIGDDDTAGVTIAQSGGSTDVAEGGATDSYTIRLDSQPTADVTISLTPDAQVTTPASLTFTAADWNVPKPVTVTAVDDAAFEGLHTGTVQHAASGGGYTGVGIANVVASVTDNDLLPVDLAVGNAALGAAVAGQRVTYEVLVDNLSATTGVASAAFAFSPPPILTNLSWTCVAEAGSSCPASGNGAPSHAIALAAAGGVRYLIGGDVPAATAAGTSLVSDATIAVTAPYQDPAPANNTAATLDTVVAVQIFRDGFEGP